MIKITTPAVPPHITRYLRPSLVAGALAISVLNMPTLANAQDDVPTPEKLTLVDTNPTGAKPSGTHTVIVEHDPSLATHTIYRPKDLNQSSFPLVVWGEGACEDAGLMFPEFLSEIASHGFVVIADGPPRRSRIRQPGQSRNETDGEASSPAQAPQVPRRPMNLRPDGSDLIAALDWAEAQNTDKNSRFSGAIDMTKVAAMGMSCGGLMAYGTASDPRVDTLGIWNSGLLQADQAIYDSIKGSVLIVTGGEDDVAFPNGKRDFETMTSDVPIFYAVLPEVGHFGTYTRDNGGDFGKVAVAWLQWQLKDDTQAKRLFSGKDCELCQDQRWQVKSRALK